MNSKTFPEKRQISKTAMNILAKRYFNNALNETKWDQVAKRVVDYVIPGTEYSQLILEMITNTYFVPNSPCLVNAGKPNTGLSACYVVNFPDTIEGIFKTKLDFALIARKGGGCGTSLSKIRPQGDNVSGSTHGYAGGPIKFADTISHDADALTQSGFRSMAIMFTMSVYHPDIIRFINAKHGETENEQENKLANANMSVMVDDAFMRAVENDETFWTEFNGKKYQEYKARDIFLMIIQGAWSNGEPGILFKNRIDQSPYGEVGQEIFSTNPCSEQPLPPNGVCNLGSLDLSKFLDENNEMNWKLLKFATNLSVKFLNNVVYKTTYPTDDIKNWSLNNAPIGLGFMGYADYLLMRKIAYGSEESLLELEKITKFIYDVAKEQSEYLGENFGYPFECLKLNDPRANITLLTIAPTGTISLIAGCSSGIEPVFSEITIRNDKTGTYTFENDLADKDYFRCAVSSNGAREVTWEEHVMTLATVQRNVDSGVSKTINFPTHTHKETMGKAVILAWRNNVKGLAMYRNGSRKIEVLTPKNLKKDKCPVCNNDLHVVGDKKKCLVCKSNDIPKEKSDSYYD